MGFLGVLGAFLGVWKVYHVGYQKTIEFNGKSKFWDENYFFSCFTPIKSPFSKKMPKTLFWGCLEGISCGVSKNDRIQWKSKCWMKTTFLLFYHHKKAFFRKNGQNPFLGVWKVNCAEGLAPQVRCGIGASETQTLKNNSLGLLQS